MKHISKRAGRAAWALFLCLVMLCCALPSVQAAPQTIPESLVTYNPFTGYNFSHNAAFAGHSLVYMIDVSEFNTVTNWGAVKSSGVDAVILRAGFRWSRSGKLQKDEKFDAYIQGALAAGLKVGVYFYSEATNEQEAAEEARTALSYLAPYKSSITLPVAFDFEFSTMGRLYNTCQTIANTQGMAAARAHGTALCRAFASEITAAGMRPMVYADRNRLQNWLNASEVAEVADIWVASWVDEDDAYTTYSASRYCAWQYCDNLRLSGISGNVDGDFLYVANDTSGGDPTPSPSTEPTPSPSPDPTPTPTPVPDPSPTQTTPGEDDNVYLLSGFTVGTTYAEIRAALAEDEDARDIILHVFDAAGNPKGDDAMLCTGDILALTTADDPETPFEIDVIVIFGDVSGDGKIDLIDIMDMHQFLCETKTPSLAGSYAADLNGDEKIDLFDLMDLRQHICGKKLIDQVKTTEDASE